MSAQASSSQAPPFRIFLSHAGEDKETVARPLYERLKKHGLSVFFDEESFRLGDDCPTVMKHAMQTAPVGVFIMSPQFVAKQWPMRELMAFVRRLDHAKQHHETPPLLIPIFYRFSTNECRDPAILETHGSLFLRHGLFQRIWSGEIRVEDVKHALDTAATVWSIRNDIGATNSDKPDMVHTRKLFISTVQNRILDKLGVERREFSESVPSAIYTQPPEQDQYTSCNTVPSNPPRLTLNYDSQTTYEGKLRAAILGASESRIVAVLATGKGGVGKTCALKGLAEDNEIKREFGGGILYMELGNDATLRDVVHGIANIVKRTGGAKLSKLIRTMESVADASQEASEWFGERRCLFLVDDIWRVNGVDSDVLDDMGRIVGTKSRMVYTTRDKQFIHDAADWIEFKERETHGELSRQMLMTHAGFDVGVELNENNKKAFEYFLTLCQGLPLGFSIIGRLVRERSWECSVREDGWFEFYNEVFLQQDVLMKTKAKSYGPIPRIVDSSLFVLNKRNKHGKHGYWFRALSVLQKQQSVPDKMLQKLWSLGTLEETRAVVKSFCDVSVVEMTRKEGEMCVKLHDLILDVAVHQAGEKNETESFFQTLVHNYMACSDGKDKSLLQRRAMSSADWETCCAWWKVKDDGYVRHNICRILRMGGYAGQLLWLLSQPQWIVSRLVGDGILSLEQDLEHGRAVCGDHGLQQADHKEHLQMIGRAGRMSAVFVNNNACAEEGWFQLHGRLQWHATLNELTKQFVEKMEKCAPRPWLKASAGLLQQAGGGGAQIVTVPGEVRGTHEERDTIWILSGDYGRMCVGRYNTRNESYRETWLEMDDCVEVGGASFLRDGRRAVTAHRGGRFIRVWNTTSGECLNTVEFCFETHRSFINFMDHGTLFACQSADRLVELCDTLSGEPVSPPLRGHKASVTCVALSADGGRIVSGSYDHTVRVWDAHTGVAVGQPLQGHTDMVTCVAFSADRGRIVSGSEDQTVRVWDAHTGRAVGEPLQGHSGWVNCVAFSADGSRIVSGSSDGTLRVWDAHTGGTVGQPLQGHTDMVTCVAFSAGRGRIVSGSDDQTVRVWGAHTGSAVGEPLQGHTGLAKCMAFSADGSRIASGSYDGTVRVWDAHTGCTVGQPLQGHTDMVTCVAFSADGGRIVSGSYDHTVRVWDAHTSVAVVQPLQGHTGSVMCVELSADGSRIVSGSEDQTVRVWDAHTGRAVGEPLQGHSGWVNCVAFSADGSRIVSGSEDQTVRVWDAHTGSAVGQPLDSHTYGVTRLALSADGSCIVSEDTEMQYLWRVNAGSYNCLLTSQDAEWQRTIDALELTWSEKKSLPARQRWVKDFAEDGSEVVLGNCEEGVFNVRGGDVYFAIDVGRNCRILR